MSYTSIFNDTKHADSKLTEKNKKAKKDSLSEKVIHQKKIEDIRG